MFEKLHSSRKLNAFCFPRQRGAYLDGISCLWRPAVPFSVLIYTHSRYFKNKWSDILISLISHCNCYFATGVFYSEIRNRDYSSLRWCFFHQFVALRHFTLGRFEWLLIYSTTDDRSAIIVFNSVGQSSQTSKNKSRLKRNFLISIRLVCFSATVFYLSILLVAFRVIC